MFRCLKKSVTPVHRGMRAFSTAVDEWLQQGTPEVRDEAAMINGDTLEKLASTLNIVAHSDSWVYNGASGAHPAYVWCTPSIMNTNELSTDGYHDTVVSMPPAPFTARMWGGGSITYGKPLRVGDMLKKSTTLAGLPIRKQGKSGDFIVYTKKINISELYNEDAKPYAVETVDYIFRDASRPLAVRPLGDGSAPQKPFDWEGRALPLTEELLFRFSALTWNAHRIHYDKEFAKKEGYSDILVHGPLQATFLLDLCGDISYFLAGEEHELSTKLRAAIAKSQAQEQHHHHHHHANGEACDGNHGDSSVPNILWHARFQKLSKFEYKALQPLVAHTPIRILARKVSDAHVSHSNPTRYKHVLRNGPAQIELWIQDARDPGTVYMQGTATFEAPNDIEYAGLTENILDYLLE